MVSPQGSPSCPPWDPWPSAASTAPAASLRRRRLAGSDSGCAWENMRGFEMSLHGYEWKPWYPSEPQITGKWMFIPPNIARWVLIHPHMSLSLDDYPWLSMISDGIDTNDNLKWCQWNWALNNEIFTEVWTIIQVLVGIVRHPYFTPFPQAWGKQSNPPKNRGSAGPACQATSPTCARHKSAV